MLSLFSPDKTPFQITDEGAEERLAELYRKYLVAQRKKQIPSSYLNLQLTDTIGSKINNLRISDFKSGFSLRNDGYFALKLNGNCETDETYIYSPIEPDKINSSNSCGLIFYDVNGPHQPNVLGIDQYIVSIHKSSVK